jgi:hypothetical protein
MMQLLSFIFMVIFLAMPAAAAQPEPKQVEPGVFRVPLSLPPSLEPRRAEFESDLQQAQLGLRAFAAKNGWTQLTDAPLMKRAEIYDTKEDYDRHVYSLDPELRGKSIPKTFTAGIEKDVFFAVSPDIYDAVFPQGREEDSYIKLIQHELAHRLHIRIVQGREEKMGPVWFYEGFAVSAADQYSAAAPKLTKEELWDIVEAKQRGSYLKYRSSFDHFLQKHTLPDLIQHAGDPDFADWLKKTDNV